MTTTTTTIERTETAVDALVRPQDLAIGETTSVFAFADDAGDDHVRFHPGFFSYDAARSVTLISRLFDVSDPDRAYPAVKAPALLRDYALRTGLDPRTVASVVLYVPPVDDVEVGPDKGWANVTAAFIATIPAEQNDVVLTELTFTRFA